MLKRLMWTADYKTAYWEIYSDKELQVKTFNC